VEQGSSFSYTLFFEDISGTIAMIFRFTGSFIALVSVIYYFSCGLPSTSNTFRILRWIIVFEGIY